VEQWAEIRRLYFVKRLSIKEIVRRTGHGRNTIRRALRAGEPPQYRRSAAGRKRPRRHGHENEPLCLSAVQAQ
jgi:IS30 family transposase